jgi:phospho-N-acetylmuramoyl-pentapeptide-transferase
MLYLLIDAFQTTVDRWALLSPLTVLRWVEFRAVAAILLGFFFVLLAGRPTIRWLIKLKIGDQPEFYNRDLNQLMQQKANTPTMGGILISGTIFLVTMLLADLTSFYVQMGLVCLTALFVLGAVDDYLKLTSARRKPGAREGLYTWEKLVLQIGLAVVLGLFINDYGSSKFAIQTLRIEGWEQMSHALTLPFMKTWVKDGGQWVPSPHLIVLGTWSFVLLSIIVISGTANAVNLTDGMDGLASGVMVVVAFAFMVLALIAGYAKGDFVLAKYLLVPYIPFSDELAVVAGAMVGACLGFLWFNCSPAQVFMGDSGSLPLGGLIGFIAVVIRQEFLLLIVGGVFVMEALSVLLQVGYFKLSGGKRVFRCAPIHHHFHLSGWTEQQVVVRFWLLTAVFVALALATIKIR